MSIRACCAAVIMSLFWGCGSSDDSPFGVGSGGKSEEKSASNSVLVRGRVTGADGASLSEAQIHVKLYRPQYSEEAEDMVEALSYEFEMVAADGSFGHAVPKAADGGQSMYGTATITYQGRVSQIVRFNVPAHLKDEIFVEIACDQHKPVDDKQVSDRFSCQLKF